MGSKASKSSRARALAVYAACRTMPKGRAFSDRHWE